MPPGCVGPFDRTPFDGAMSDRRLRGPVHERRERMYVYMNSEYVLKPQ